MRVAVFDCFSGIAGDMTVAALLDAGAPLDAIRSGLGGLGLPAFDLVPTQVQRAGMRAVHVDVRLSEERTYQPEEMRTFFRSAAWPERAKARAVAAVDALEAAEIAAHGSLTAHFHEVGGVDAVVDIGGAMLALEALDIAAASCAVVTVGSAAISRSGHGAIPASPPPAAAHILQQAGFPLRFVEAAHELVTPTGAAILAAVARPGATTMTPLAHGAGAGTFDPPSRPNAVRVFVGETEGAPAGPPVRTIRELSANIDDMPPSLLALARDQLLAAGALDAWTEPIGMKKGRAAEKLCALALPEDEARLAGIFLRHTTTLGVRVADLRRYEAPREQVVLETSLGPVRFKVRNLPGARRANPELEDVRALAGQLDRPALDIQSQLEREAPGLLP